MTTWADLLISFCGQFCLLALQVSMVTSAVEIQQSGNEKGLSSAPYLCLLVNCAIWTIYSIMKGYVALFIPNAIGIFAGFYCALIFHQYSRQPIPSVNMAIAAAVLLLGILLGAAGSVGAIGLFAVIMSSIVYASPLATIATVIQDQSTASMPFHTSMLVWLSAAFWTLYGGVVTHDVTVLVPSLAGLIMASIQLFMFVLYGLPPNERYDCRPSVCARNQLTSNYVRSRHHPTEPTIIAPRGRGAAAGGTTSQGTYKVVRTMEPKETDPTFQELKTYQ